MTDAPGLLLEHVSLRWPDGTQSLDDLHLEIRGGALVAVLGPSGCGKSTLLRLLAGTLAPTDGKVHVLPGSGAQQARVPSHPAQGARPQPALAGAWALTAPSAPSQQQRPGDLLTHDRAFVFQQARLLPWRSVQENVALPLELRGTPDPSRVAEAIAAVGLQDFCNALPHQLSGGMAMRASIARALVTNPRMLLLDEPFAALDDITRRRLGALVLGLWQQGGWTGVFVTHNSEEAAWLAGRVVVMSRRPGRVLADLARPWPWPRPSNLQSTPEFVCYLEEIRQALAQAEGER